MVLTYMENVNLLLLCHNRWTKKVHETEFHETEKSMNKHYFYAMLNFLTEVTATGLSQAWQETEQCRYLNK